MPDKITMPPLNENEISAIRRIESVINHAGELPTEEQIGDMYDALSEMREHGNAGFITWCVHNWEKIAYLISDRLDESGEVGDLILTLSSISRRLQRTQFQNLWLLKQIQIESSLDEDDARVIRGVIDEMMDISFFDRLK